MINLELLTFRLKATLQKNFPDSKLIELQPLTGGASGLTYLAELQGEALPPKIVIKVAPPGVAPIGHRDVLRQARILNALNNLAGIAVPKVIFEDAGDPVETPPLYAMEYVAGTAFEPNKDVLLPHETLPSPDILNERAFLAVNMLATLHNQSVRELGIEGEVTFTPAAELERWRRLIMKVETELQSEAEALIAELATDVPASLPPTLLHGDFRLGNLLCRDSAIVSIIDWEIWGVGDQRIDLAWFLLTAEPTVHPLAIRNAPGMPPASKLYEAYQSACRKVENLHWFRALALLKMAASTALIVKNNLRIGDPAGRAAQLKPLVPVMLERAKTSLC